MDNATRAYYDKRGELVVKNLRKRQFEAHYCPTAAEARAKVLELMEPGSSVGWGGAATAAQLGIQEAVHAGDYVVYDRDRAEDRVAMMHQCLTADYFLTGANAISLDGQMVNIDGMGNRVAAMVYGPKYVIVVAGMNKVCATLEDAVRRARTVAAPMNAQRFGLNTPCAVTGACGNCTMEDCICNQMLITRHCKPAGRIKFVLVGEELGF